jgi:hypothetical protein
MFEKLTITKLKDNVEEELIQKPEDNYMRRKCCCLLTWYLSGLFYVTISLGVIFLILYLRHGKW